MAKVKTTLADIFRARAKAGAGEPTSKRGGTSSSEARRAKVSKARAENARRRESSRAITASVLRASRGFN